jgi:hypothetical protein
MAYERLAEWFTRPFLYQLIASSNRGYSDLNAGKNIRGVIVFD